MSLWRALWTGFGWPYISLGLLKLFSDALNFAGTTAIPCPFPADLPSLLTCSLTAWEGETMS